jgi:hypothetical protein
MQAENREIALVARISQLKRDLESAEGELQGLRAEPVEPGPISAAPNLGTMTENQFR